MKRFARSMLRAGAAVLITVGLVMAFHDSLARWITVQLVHQVPGIEAQLDGPFDVTHVAPLTLDAAGFSLAFTGDRLTGTRARFGSVHLEMPLWPLLRGVVHIKRLRIADADIEIPSAGAAVRPGQSLSAPRIPAIEELLLERVDVRFERAADRSPHDLSIAKLRLDESDGGVLTATGTANLDDHGLQLTAALGSVEQLLRPTAPFPIDVTLRAPSWDLEARVSGTLDGPLGGRTARLDVRAKTSDMTALREVFLPDAPFAGSVDAKAHLSGDLHAPALSDISFTIEDKGRLHVMLRGSIAELPRLEGLDLQVDAASRDPGVTRYLTREAIPAVQTIRFQTAVRSKANAYLLEGLDVDMSGKNQLSVGARGSLHLTSFKSQWAIEKALLDLRLSAAVADLAAWLPPEVGKTGTLRLQTHLEGSAESLGFNELTLDLDNTQPLRGKINGTLAYTAAQLEAIRTRSESSTEVWIPAEVDLLADLTTADLQSLSPLLGQALPDLGALTAKGRVQRNGHAIRITQLDGRTSGNRPLGLSTEGQLTLAGFTADQGMTEVDLRVTAEGPDAKSVASLIGPLPIDPGHWSLKAQIKGKTGALRAEGVEFEAGTDDSVHARVQGSISDLEHLIAHAGKTPTGVKLRGQVTAVSTQQLGTLIRTPFPNLGRFDARFDARGDRAMWSIANATVAITHSNGLDLRATGEASDLLHDTRFDVRLELQVPDPKGAAAGMGGSLPRLPAISADAQIQGTQKQARFNGRIDLGTMPIKTDLEADFSGPRPHLSGTLSTPVLKLSDIVSPEGLSKASLDKPAAPVTTTVRERPGLDRIFSDEPLGFEHLNHADIDLKLIADHIGGVHIRTESLELTIEVANGHLKAHHKKLKHENGALSTALEIDNATDPPRVMLKVRGDNVSLGALYAEVSAQPRLTEGLYSLDLDLTGVGHSLRRLLATANGHYGHVIEHADLVGGDLDAMNFGLLKLVMATAVSKDHTDIDCAVAKFRVKNGLATSETLFLHTSKLVAAGAGYINFSDETLDIVVNTETKRLLIKKKAALRIHGPIRQPLIDTDLTETGVTAGLEAAAIGAATAALPVLGLSLAALEHLGEYITDGEQQPCLSGEVSKK